MDLGNISMTRDTIESTRRLEFSRLKELGFLPKPSGYKSGNITWRSSGERVADIDLEVSTENPAYIRLKYKCKKSWEPESEYRSYDYQFSLENIACHFGGYRWYVRCGLSKNGIPCNRRVRALYAVGDYFGCRHCADLTYESCNENKKYRGLGYLFDIDDLEASVKRKFYAGKPTRKYRKLLRMERQFDRVTRTNGDFLRQMGL
jgi:hypothetical protein